MKIIVFIVSLVLLPSLLQAQTVPPEGWRFPTEADYSDGWKEFRSKIPTPFHAQADFNGDGVTDDAWILLSTTSKAWGLFLFEGSKEGPPRIVTLDSTDAEKGRWKSRAQSMGIQVAETGDYVTACGKGYWPCKNGEPKAINIVRPGIDFFQYESADSLFLWDGKTKNYNRIWISD